MTETSTDLDARLRVERARLLEALEALDERAWLLPSLCAGWSIRDVGVHLLMPYELSAPKFFALMLRARFNFDRLADRWARADRRSPAQIIAGLRETEHRKFGVPGAPSEAALCHLAIHAQDIYRPLGLSPATDPETAAIVLSQLTGARGGMAVTKTLLAGFAFTAADTPWRYGAGPQVSGPATALMQALTGRSSALHELSGAGVTRFSQRLQEFSAALS